jgi:ferric-dicitrate binding protein FerR (iron transport regulator)
VKALDRIEVWGRTAVVGKSGDGMRAWRDALCTAARRLEGAWLALEEAVAVESERLEAVVRDVAQWRKPMWPVVLTGVVGIGVAVWLGLVFGGYVASPAWFTAIWSEIAGS